MPEAPKSGSVSYAITKIVDTIADEEVSGAWVLLILGIIGLVVWSFRHKQNDGDK